MRGAFLALALTLVASSGCTDKSQASGGDAAPALAKSDAGEDASVDAGTLDDAAMPGGLSPDLEARMRHLLEAIAQNNPDLAGDALFPRDGFVATKDAADPQKLWDRRVSSSYRRSIERMHKHLKGAEHAKFVSFELGRGVTQITPKKKDFKKPLWRVKHSKIAFTVDGKARHLDIAEMTAWRGAWYITRLR
jgi:hypothetical protein